MKKIAILGSTGSIGRQTLEVIAAHPDRFRVSGLAGWQNARLLAEQAKIFHPDLVACADHGAYAQLRQELAGTSIPVLAGAEGVAAVAAAEGTDLTLIAVTGAAGIAPTLAAIDAGKEIALANKETLVAAGALVTKRARAAGVRILPVDSEHSAVFQCLAGIRQEALHRIILTASGGPFRTLPLPEMDRVTVAQALNHPKWNMGAKITVDSATLVNKGLEVIEAHWLFGLPYERIEVVIHPESLVHSLVELVDGAILAQLGTPDMRLPIAYALSYPDRIETPWPRLPGLAGLALHFERPDEGRFPALKLAYEMGRRGGTWPTVMSAANEVSVAAFLRGELSYRDIVRIVTEVCGNHGGGNESCPDLETIFAADAWARARAAELVSKNKK
ncbi:MAG: 1-deoxy-D-xylulose-5-phosphate reductoisomerase [Bacteroidota bacterium]